jgi:ATP-dependent exoDNAse (exonuclease V) alpha subunit
MIPVIVKGHGVSGALRYVMSEGHIEKKEDAVTYALMRAVGDTPTKTYKTLAEDEQTRVEILGGQNFGFDIHDARTVELARRMMEWNGKPENQASRGRKCEVDCLHLMLNWDKGLTPDNAEKLEAGQSVLKALGMENAQAVFVAHHDKEHAHLHVVASRIDPTTGKTFSQKDDQIIAQAWGVQWDRQHGIKRDSGLDRVADIVERRDCDALLEHLTKDRPTFLVPTLNRALRFGGLSDEDRAEFRAELMAHPSLVPLRDEAQGRSGEVSRYEVSRYTTREILKDEMRVMRDAAVCDADKSHGIDGAKIDRLAEQFTLKPEQADAVRHLTGEGGLSILWGEAGTGKSHTLKAARTAYEEEGAQVIGLSWTNKVVQDMRANGFENSDTVQRQLNALNKGKTVWNDQTVLMVDEAGMLSTSALAALTHHAAKAGAKLILAGDDAQLASIEPGGMFGKLRQDFGAATLSEVQRVGKDAEQQRAFNAMHAGDFKTALDIFESKGAINWTSTQADALTHMADRYAASVAAAPDKSRFMFAYTNKDVAALNEQARALHKERGDLGDDVLLRTAYGPQAYATGDRVQFSGNAWTQEARESGLVNGRVGTVEALAYDDHGKLQMTVALDSGTDAQSVTFTVGEDAKAGEFHTFKRGYAGTIYKGQGATLDESFVLADDKWRDSGAYVALSRHRESVHVFASHECFDNLDDMARSFSRSDGKDAALSYIVADAILLEIGADLAAEHSAALEIEHRPTLTAEFVAGDLAARDEQEASAAATSTNQSDHEAEAATESPLEEALDAVEDIAGEVAGAAMKAADVLFAALMGETKTAAPAPMTAAERHAAKVKSFAEREYQQHAARLQEIAKSLGSVDSAMTEDELKREQEAQEKRSRDRGGGISR